MLHQWQLFEMKFITSEAEAERVLAEYEDFLSLSDPTDPTDPTRPDRHAFQRFTYIF